MAKFEETALYQALVAEEKDGQTIVSALGSATVDFTLRSSTGQTYIHLAAANRKLVREVYLSICNNLKAKLADLV